MKKFLAIVIFTIAFLSYAGEKEETARVIFGLVSGTRATDDEVIMIASVLQNRVKGALMPKHLRSNSMYAAAMKFSEGFVDKNDKAWILGETLSKDGKVEDKEITNRWELCLKYSTDWFKPTVKAVSFDLYVGKGSEIKSKFFAVEKITEHYQSLIPK